MYNSYEDESDPLREFLAQLLKDFPDVPPLEPISIPLSSSSSPLPDPPIHCHYPDAHSTCQWTFSDDSPLICGSRLSQDPKQVCFHLRNIHNLRGNEKEINTCYWRDCRTAPMQRGSVIRHVLTVHLGLMKWRCERCAKLFSRKGTMHACNEDERRADSRFFFLRP